MTKPQSTKRSTPSASANKGIAKQSTNYANLVIAIVVVAAAVIFVSDYQKTHSISGSPDFAAQSELRKFSSEQELQEFLNKSTAQNNYYGGYAVREMMMTADSGTAGGAPGAAPTAAKSESAQGSDFSGTNVQIEGVDEADFTKSDGRYIYTIADGNVVIVDAYPAEKAEIVSTINLSGEQPQSIYVNGDKLIIFGHNYSYDYPYPMPLMEGGAIAGGVAEKVAAPMAERMGIMPIRFSETMAYVKIYDIADRTAPRLEREVQFNGTYYDSRMIGNYVYMIANSQPYYFGGHFQGFSPMQGAFPDVYYFPVPDNSYQFTNIISLDVNNGNVNNKVFLLGYSSNIFVSQDNIYLVYQKRVSQNFIQDKVIDEIIIPLTPDDVDAKIAAVRSSYNTESEKSYEVSEIVRQWTETLSLEDVNRLYESVNAKYQSIQEQYAKELEKSVVHKISIDNGNIEYKTKGEVSGTPLNQFSMDEHKGYFRIATTTSTGTPLNHMYVLDDGMNVVGKLEDLAKGESIYSVRFMGDRAYMVTFKYVDPLFVIDLSDPSAPKVLGKLKIPGYSDYLHPYDENHVIGVGKDVDETIDADKVHDPNAVYYTAVKGVKVSLFDVTDVSNPVEVGKYVIGDRGTDSEALYDHKAFLFYKERNLLVLPIRLYEIKGIQDWGEYTWQGAYVFDIDASSLALKGRVTHSSFDAKDPNNYYDWNAEIRRSMYINHVLYTVSNKMIKANDLSDLGELNAIKLPLTEYPLYKMYAEGGVAMETPPMPPGMGTVSTIAP